MQSENVVQADTEKHIFLFFDTNMILQEKCSSLQLPDIQFFMYFKITLSNYLNGLGKD